MHLNIYELETESQKKTWINLYMKPRQSFLLIELSGNTPRDSELEKYLLSVSALFTGNTNLVYFCK